jgi:hypothetical protein
MSEFIIRHLGDDEFIREDGFYHLPIERHHQQPCVGPSITSSVLRSMEYHGPRYTWAFHYLNPGRLEKKISQPMLLGKAMSMVMEEGMMAIDANFKVLPGTAPRRPTKTQRAAFELTGEWSELAAPRAEFYDDFWDLDLREEIDEDQYEKLVFAGAALSQDEAARAVFEGAHSEVTMAWLDEETGLWVLSRPDMLSFSGVLTDYKLVNPGGQAFNQFFCDKKVDTFGYHQQMGLIDESWSHLTGTEASAVGIIFQSADPPWEVIPKNITRDNLERGAFLNRRARRNFATCLETGVWPGAGDKITDYRMAPWLQKRIDEDMALALATWEPADEEEAA